MGQLMGAWVKAIGICPIGNNVAIVVGLGRFLPRDAMLARYMLSSCPSQAGIVLYRNDWTNRAGFFAWMLLPIPHCVVRKFGYLRKLV